MKKWLVIVLLVFCPIFLKADSCNYDKHTEYSQYASLISYETEYSMGEATFTIKFYNVISGLRIVINKSSFNPDENDTVVVSSIKEGSKLNVYVYANDGCSSQVGNINIELPYYNPYYNTEICRGYEQLTLCSSQFTAYKATRQMIEETKKSYDSVVIQDKEANETSNDKPNIISKIGYIFTKYILKILLVIASSGLTIWYYNNKLIKVEHGV